MVSLVPLFVDPSIDASHPSAIEGLTALWVDGGIAIEGVIVSASWYFSIDRAARIHLGQPSVSCGPKRQYKMVMVLFFLSA